MNATTYGFLAAITLSLGLPAIVWTDEGKSPTTLFVGRWECLEQPPLLIDGKPVVKGLPTDFKFDFRKDGTFDGEMIFPVKGMWKVLQKEGKRLTVELHVETPDLAKNDPKVQPKTEKLEFTVVFNNDNEMTMTPTNDKKNTLTFQRKK